MSALAALVAAALLSHLVSAVGATATVTALVSPIENGFRLNSFRTSTPATEDEQ